MTLPLILGLPATTWGGFVLAVLIALNVLGGLKVLKIPFKAHKTLGILILAFGLVHAAVGMLAWFGVIKVA
jgi:hypothetical protein